MHHPQKPTVEESDGSGDIATGDDSHRTINWILIAVAAILVIGGQIHGLDKSYKWFTAMAKWFRDIL